MYQMMLDELAWFQQPIGPDGGVVVLAVLRLIVGFIELAFARRARVAPSLIYLMAATQLLSVVTAPIAPKLSVFTLLGNSIVGLWFYLAWQRARQEGLSPEAMQQTIVRQEQRIYELEEAVEMYRAKDAHAD